MSNICNKLPIGKQLMATDELFRKEMHSLFNEIREHAPIMEDKELNPWVITKHGYVREIFRKKTVCVRDWEKYSAENTFARKMGEQIGKLGMLDMDDIALIGFSTYPSMPGKSNYHAGAKKNDGVGLHVRKVSNY